MKLKTIITILLAVAALTVQAQTKVWDNIVMGYDIGSDEIKTTRNLPVSAKISIFAAENKLKTCR